MKILIINLPRYKNSSVTREGRCELLFRHRVDTPATLLIIAAQLKKHNYEIDFIDANGLNITYDAISKSLKRKKFDIAIFTFASSIIDEELRFCKIVKLLNPLCITIGYSWYAKKYWKEILTAYSDLDILIIGDPFSVIENLIKNLNEKGDLRGINGIAFRDKNKEIILNPKITSRKKFNELPIPAYELLHTFKPYYLYSPLFSPYALIYAGKGCPFSCGYCPVAKTKYSGRSGKEIVKELKLLKKLANIKFIWFFDEIFTINRKRVLEICGEIIKEKLKIKWFCDSRVDLVDLDLLKLMRKAGCIGISYGVESGSQKILDAMNKGITVQQALKALKWTRKARIPIQLNLLFGYIGENSKTLKETEIFVKKTLPEFLQISTIIALNNTKFYDIALENKWLTENLDWKTDLEVGYHKLVNYKPFSYKLRDVRGRFYRMLYSIPKWWLNNILTLIRNPLLILPLIYILLKKSEFRSII
ncbi:MAG: B12-binding domain-containing radical SAM protein [Promethearchaeota archaeon]